MKGEPAGTLPIVTQDPLGTGFSRDPETYEFFEKWKGKDLDWPNKVTIKRYIF